MSRVRLDQIVFDAGTQIRVTIDQHVVSDYAEAMTSGESFPPIVLFHDGTANYLADGFHRFLAAQRNKFKDIDADVQAGTKDDALWFALGANKTHGKQLTPADKKWAIELALKTWGQGGRTQAEIARQIGMAESTLSYHATRLSDTGRLQRPSSVIDRDGRTLPIPARSRSVERSRRNEIEERLKRGEKPAAIAQAVHIHRNRVFEIKRALGLSTMPDRSRPAVQQRLKQMRAMAADGHTSIQIASALSISVEGCRSTLRHEHIAVPADKVTKGTRHPESNRIVERIVADAENLTEGVQLIDFASLDRQRVGEWIDSLIASKRALEGFIKRLIKERAKHGKAA